MEGALEGGAFEGPRVGREGPSDLGNLVELAEELVEHEHQLLRGALTGQPCEAHDVSIQHAGQADDVSGAKVSGHAPLPSGHPLSYLTPWCLLT